ncbi:hypothetical protein E3D00_03165 [Swingsia samuiensis]|uniref:Uncharacterized protein n=2 Tax=Swingsia samuiensis TaxID=1293412 RepID=A0A4Y6UKX3_9PROT|nr:hypothetical protein E3D00_03165 [Swingsia samuiensis]
MQATMYAPGARSSASANGVLDGVIGEHPQKIKKTIQSHGKYYYITNEGKVLDEKEKEKYNNIQNSKYGNYNTISQRRHSVNQNGKLEPVFIGVMDIKTMNIKSLHYPGCQGKLQPIMNSSVGPVGVFIVPEICLSKNPNEDTLVHVAAQTLAKNNGNLYGMAGNHAQIRSANYAVPLPGNSAILLSNTPSQSKSP